VISLLPDKFSVRWGIVFSGGKCTAGFNVLSISIKRPSNNSGRSPINKNAMQNTPRILKCELSYQNKRP
jgi:hypothetical protein